MNAISIDTQARIIAEQRFTREIELFDRNRDHFGISEDVDLHQSELGEGVPVYARRRYTLDVDKPLRGQLVQLPEVLFPVLLDGKWIAEFQVVLDRDKDWDLYENGSWLQQLEAAKPLLAQGREEQTEYFMLLQGWSWMIGLDRGKYSGVMVLPGFREVNAKPDVYGDRKLMHRIIDSTGTGIGFDTKMIPAMSELMAERQVQKMESVSTRLWRYAGHRLGAD